MLDDQHLSDSRSEPIDKVALEPAPPATPGQRLREARESMQASLSDVSRDTKITEHYLESIEIGDYRDFNARIYVVGFARNYARFVGIAEQPIAEAVAKHYDETRRSDGWAR